MTTTISDLAARAREDRRAAKLSPLPSPRWRRTRALLLVADVGAIAVGALLAVLVWRFVNPSVDGRVFLQLWPLALAFPFGYLLSGLYPGAAVGPVEELRRLSLVTSGVYAVALLALFLTQETGMQSRGTFVLAWLFTLVAVPVARGSLRMMAARRSWWGVPAVLLGAGKTAELLLERLEGNPDLDMKVIACFDDDPAKIGTRIHGVPVVGPLAAAAPLGEAWRARRALVAMPGLDPSDLARLVREHAHAFPHLVFIPNLFGMTSVGVAARDLGGVVGLHAKQNLLLPTNRAAKRVLDALLLLPALVVGLPLIALGALAVVLVDPGNPFYAQPREGRGRSTLRVWKLRTMRKDADARLRRHLEEHPEAKREWEAHYKLERDPRVLPFVGELLRRSSLDELPQLLNILRGEMSFVGPRPFPYYHLENFGEEFRDLRASVRPGLTGFWQVTSRSTADLAAQEQLDSHYIRNWSPWMDLYLLARTPWAVVFGKGAY